MAWGWDMYVECVQICCGAARLHRSMRLTCAAVAAAVVRGAAAVAAAAVATYSCTSHVIGIRVECYCAQQQYE